MESLMKKRKVARTADSFGVSRHGNLRASHDSYAKSVQSLEEEGQQQMKKRKDAVLGSNNFVPRAAATDPTSRKGSLPDKPLRGLKRKIGCIEAATQFGRKRKLIVDYELGQVLGQGKFGLVRLCKNKATGEMLACKTLPKKTEENVHREVEIMQHLSGHRNIVTLCAVYEDDESLHLVMELCSNGRLVDEIYRHGRYSESQAAVLIRELVTVIKYCHEMGVVHRDIKPENILRSSTGQLKLADFGLSTRIAEGQRIRGKVGSPAYVAPEVLNGAYTEKVDTWAAGVLLHLLLFGALPFRGNSVEEIFKSVREVTLDVNSEPWQALSARARDLLSKMLSRDPEKRPSPQEVLRHPWILSHTESLQADSPTRKKHKISHIRVRNVASQKIVQEAAAGPRLETKRESSSRESRPFASPRRKSCYSNIQQEFQTPIQLDIVDALATAISRMKLSEPKRSRLCLTTCPITDPSPSNIKMNMCKAF
eukprot:TRINITY_DN27424_c0_g2_i1.p1 TRINITY_DN27424_c0_g2~~TRINITY_DN27424_c0_g2_i1.p1  ORF type:complete len:481 (-),score=105.39 TRINITY_DN27424_c0_g2_i1:248-1690(-)